MIKKNDLGLNRVLGSSEAFQITEKFSLFSNLTDPSASDDLWQIETAPDLESQVILVRLTLNTRVYIKVRAKSPYGDSDFSETVAFDTTAATGQEARGIFQFFFHKNQILPGF
jgi:hypothetical protein